MIYEIHDPIRTPYPHTTKKPKLQCVPSPLRRRRIRHRAVPYNRRRRHSGRRQRPISVQISAVRRRSIDHLIEYPYLPLDLCSALLRRKVLEADLYELVLQPSALVAQAEQLTFLFWKERFWPTCSMRTLLGLECPLR